MGKKRGKVVANFSLDKDLLTDMREIKERDGVPLSEQARRGLRLWTEQHNAAHQKAAFAALRSRLIASAR